MLRIVFGSLPDAIFNTSVYFDNVYLDKWLEDDLSIKIIKDIDRATVLGPMAVESKILGVIPVKQLSGGTKTLLLLRNAPNKIYNISACGDNCAKWILKIAEESKTDITVNLQHIMDFGKKPFEIEIVNAGKTVRSMEEYVLLAVQYLQ